jgi:hypothetical protein
LEKKSVSESMLDFFKAPDPATGLCAVPTHFPACLQKILPV